MGIVYFVGAGPGDPTLMTLKGQQLIASADVLIYAGSLVSETVMADARPDAQRYNSAGITLDEQVRLMQEATAQGQTVVRLHTGDPSVYGAVFEQMRRLREVGIAYQIVPGVSAAFAAAAALGIEYTLPENTQTVMFTRLGGRTPVPESERLRDLAAHRTSMVIFLSIGMIGQVVDELRAAGYADETPVAVVFRATWPDEQVLHGCLADIGAQVETTELTHHALIVVSPALQPEVVAAVPDSHLYGTAMQAAERQPTRAIIALTRGGTATGQKLLAELPNAVLYAPKRFVEAQPNVHPYVESIRQVLQTAFRQHSGLVCIMASGIVVRDLAPLLHSKHHDPGVVVVDQTGRYAISLLGGHKGGANQLALDVAQHLGGEAVLTTSSDVQALPALDLLGSEWGWYIERMSHMTQASAALVNGDLVGVFQEAGNADWLTTSPPNITRYNSLVALSAAKTTAALLITPRVFPEDVFSEMPATVIYRPPCLYVGVGCNRGTPAQEIIDAVRQTLHDAELSLASLAALATIDAKADEVGLRAACEQMDWKLLIFSQSDIAAVGDLPNPSVWAEQALGVRGVAEPAAMLAAATSTLLVEKRKFANVTVAVALRREEEV
ncbi:MAG: hypothetical protein GFH27_549283n87 [Chloroflexi bacterium AL-W]|nr:hypothetical protein [Chloroflexi bacterium AL-N1]NOK64792.1 hypothetical protein [Chloroflexi bacterium AL-N10]NOK76562.1 hypothetical protein [Chloroflexi bacterium AL-N5]NOK80208.1 hypothetical protein [Chloroflexi bacterium AL-W]NOK86721.1 hypothetical protein [Chloroflexi bacterium AL-N15]